MRFRGSTTTPTLGKPAAPAPAPEPRSCYPVPMAKPCPACTRPNSDAATKCLYCSQPLASPADESSTLSPLPADDWHLVILIPSGPPDEGMIESLSDVAGVSRYDARLSLSSTRPRILRRVESDLSARGLSERLRASRIPHYVVSEKSILALPVTRAQRGELQEQALELSVEGTTLSIPYEDILVCVRGEITRENHNERKIATAKGANRSLSPGLLLHLYSKEASVAVEVDSESFTWPSSGHEPTRSAILELERFLDSIEDKMPGVLVDRGFDLRSCRGPTIALTWLTSFPAPLPAGCSSTTEINSDSTRAGATACSGT